MSELYKTVGSTGYDQLLADPQGADVITISCEPGNGVITRGTLMYTKATKMYAPAAAAQAVDTNMLVVLNENVDTGNTPAKGETATAEDAAAYRAGRFIDGRVKLAANAALTDAIKVTLRKQNIVFNTKESTSTVDNKVTGE